ncbi:hypothetical protein BH24ACT26_BH24ACT26_01310 [soil metagenome]
MNNLRPKNPELVRCLSSLRSLHRSSATEIISTPFGEAFFNTDFPDKQDLNVFWVNRMDSHLAAGALIRDVESLQEERGLGYRRLMVEDKGALEVLSPLLQAPAWGHSSNLLMTTTAPGQLPATNEITVQLVTREQLREHMYHWYLGEEGLTDDDATMLIEAGRVTDQAVPTLHLAAVVGTNVAGWCELRIIGQTAQLENLGTLPQFRRRGVATALVNEAINLSYRKRADVIFLQTDSADHAQHLYSRLGFVRVGALHRFLKTVT